MPMSENTQKEHLGYVFVRAVAYAAGFSCYVPEVDDDSIDLGIARRGSKGSVRSPRVELQVKCTGEGRFQKMELGYQLPLKNYDDLRHNDYQVPRILIVALVPTSGTPLDWMKQTHAQLTIKHSPYWLSLRGLPDYVGVAKDPKVSVRLLKRQVFDPASLTAMMDRIATGGLP